VSGLQTGPLLDLFTELRARNFPLGVGDYIGGLRALAGVVGVTSRDDLIFMCRVLWGKSREEQSQIAEILGTLLPPRFSVADLEALVESERANVEARTTPSEEAPSTTLPPTRSDYPPSSQAPISEAPSLPSSEATTTAYEPGYENEGFATVTLGRQVEARLAGGGVAVQNVEGAEWLLDPQLDLIGTLPVTKRQMKNVWRFFRRMQRVGTPTELDVTATTERVYRQGVFLSPVLVPRRLNLARLLILVDEGGSMVPFRRVTDPLLETARQGGLALVSIFYFHDVATGKVHRSAALDDAVPLADLARDFDGAGVLIVSDAGAARGRLDERRVRLSRRFIDAVRLITPNVAWLNPMPRDRWKGTTAEEVRLQCAVSMFPLDRAGLYAAVERLRGR
jgi:hypothetical protein